jgi:hypothetical protein
MKLSIGTLTWALKLASKSLNFWKRERRNWNLHWFRGKRRLRRLGKRPRNFRINLGPPVSMLISIFLMICGLRPYNRDSSIRNVGLVAYLIILNQSIFLTHKLQFLLFSKLLVVKESILFFLKTK